MSSLWENYDVYVTRKEIIEKANEKFKFSNYRGGFVCTDGAWCCTSNPKEFKEMLEYFFDFEIIECKETKSCTALATTKCGLQIAWNGYVRIVNNE